MELNEFNSMTFHSYSEKSKDPLPPPNVWASVIHYKAMWYAYSLIQKQLVSIKNFDFL